MSSESVQIDIKLYDDCDIYSTIIKMQPIQLQIIGNNQKVPEANNYVIITLNLWPSIEIYI